MAGAQGWPIKLFAYCFVCDHWNGLCVVISDPKFYENIAAYDIEQYRKVLSPAKFAIKLKEIKQQLKIITTSFYNFTAMI